MSLLTKPTDLREKVLAKKENAKRGDQLVSALHRHFDDINDLDYFPVKEVEELMLKEQQHFISKIGKRKDFPEGLPRFSPSSSDKCERELFFKAIRATQDESIGFPFQRRWTRNSTAVHGAVQKQLLEAEYILDDPAFKVRRLANGLPAWEKSVEQWREIEHNGVRFVVYGMCDGILEYKDGTQIGFEFKTKSNSVAQIKQLKEPAPSHKMQTVAYSILFGIDEWLITYESVAKDKWGTAGDARPDMKIFYHKVTDRDRKQLLDKWARVAHQVNNGEVSAADTRKCMFCPFKTVCSEVGL
ncbi:hypothetical protein CHCC14819_0460 [Bacillus licheniformis]|uniref:PD-(D/E)XK nuclease family protein n=1 Tax=Bacillus licheniformis TaxID=1402 RepID=UPI00119D8215|nr:PD-(D/E)XK nuclease family protein [Bacillus licheniformis]TWM32264.1 hypothetical protein CHCC14819_0460 [Bacillus licheniformis]